MTEIIILDAVNVATIARAARDAAAGFNSQVGIASSTLSMLPDDVSAVLTRIDAPTDGAVETLLTGYAVELDEIAEAVVSLDQREHELEHQLRWWGERISELEPLADGESRRELALYRGRVSGAHAMQRHYQQERIGLFDRLEVADATCASELARI